MPAAAPLPRRAAYPAQAAACPGVARPHPASAEPGARPARSAAGLHLGRARQAREALGAERLGVGAQLAGLRSPWVSVGSNITHPLRAPAGGHPETAVPSQWFPAAFAGGQPMPQAQTAATSRADTTPTGSPLSSSRTREVRDVTVGHPARGFGQLLVRGGAESRPAGVAATTSSPRALRPQHARRPGRSRPTTRRRRPGAVRRGRAQRGPRW